MYDHCVAMQLLGGRTGPDGMGLMGAYQIRDGVLAFQDADDAQRFAQQLEAEGNTQVWILELNQRPRGLVAWRFLRSSWRLQATLGCGSSSCNLHTVTEWWLPGRLVPLAAHRLQQWANVETLPLWRGAQEQRQWWVLCRAGPWRCS